PSTAWYKNRNLELVQAAENELRWNYFAQGKAGWLIEPYDSQNAFTYSSDFTDDAWVKTRVTITENAADEPKAEPAVVAQKIVENTDNNTHPVSRFINGASDNTFQAVSVIAKAGERFGL